MGMTGREVKEAGLDSLLSSPPVKKKLNASRDKLDDYKRTWKTYI